MGRSYELKEKRPRSSTPDKFEWNIYDLIDGSNSIPIGTASQMMSVRVGSLDIPAKETRKQYSKKKNGADHGSKFLSNALKSYKVEVNRLAKVIMDTQGLLKKLVPIFRKADKDFSSFTLDALEFVAHFMVIMVIMETLGPIYETMIEVLNPPEEYHDTVVKIV